METYVGKEGSYETEEGPDLGYYPMAVGSADDGGSRSRRQSVRNDEAGRRPIVAGRGKCQVGVPAGSNHYG